MKPIVLFTSSLLLALSPLSALFAAAPAPAPVAAPVVAQVSTPAAVTSLSTKVGVVSVRTCFDQSKDGHRARDTLENLNKQATRNLEELDRQLEEISSKLSDDDVRDSMAQDAEKELQERYEALAQEREMKRMQFGQQINQMQMTIMQQLFDTVSHASEKVASQMGLDLIMQEDSTFYFNAKIDVTEQVVAKMNHEFDEQQKVHSAEAKPAEVEATKTTVKETKK